MNQINDSILDSIRIQFYSSTAQTLRVRPGLILLRFDLIKVGSEWIQVRLDLIFFVFDVIQDRINMIPSEPNMILLGLDLSQVSHSIQFGFDRIQDLPGSLVF